MLATAPPPPPALCILNPPHLSSSFLWAHVSWIPVSSASPAELPPGMSRQPDKQSENLDMDLGQEWPL
jgi:hypothetical protein